MHRILFGTLMFFFGTIAVAKAEPALARPDQPLRRPSISPWGVSSSASAFKDHADWFPKMASAGVTTVRLFPSWRTIETIEGAWHWDKVDSLVATAAENRIEISGLLLGSPPGAATPHAP